MLLPYARLTDPASYVLPQIVRTPRLLLRSATADDAAAVAQARGESYAELLPLCIVFLVRLSHHLVKPRQ